MAQGASVRTATRWALVADDDADRAVVVAGLLEHVGFAVRRLISTREIIKALDDMPHVPCLIAAKSQLADGPLIPALRRRYRDQGIPLPRLLLWAPNGLFDMRQYKHFLQNQFAVPFAEPVDVDALLAVARIFFVLDGLRG